MSSLLPMAKSGATELRLPPSPANRRDLVTGATGTGETVTPQALALQLSSIGMHGSIFGGGKRR